MRSGSFQPEALLSTRDARTAKRGIASVSHPSVRPSVCLSVSNVDVPWVYRLDSFEINYTK